MKFSVPRDTLLQPLDNVIGAVEKKQTEAIYGNVLIEAVSDGLTLTSTDSAIELRSSESTIIDVPGSVTVPARKLYDYCRSLSESASINFSLQGDQVKLTSGKSRFALSTLNASEFPNHAPIVNGKQVTLAEKDLAHVIRRTAFAMAVQDVRYYLNGLLLEINEKNLCCVATDGHRLAYSQLEVNSVVDEPVHVIIPRKSVLELARLLGDSDDPVELSVEDKRIGFKLPGVNMITKLVEGRFPDYNRVIPIDGDKLLKIDKETFVQVLGRTAILVSDKIMGVRLALSSNQVAVNTTNSQHEKADDEIEAEYSDDELQIGLNVFYLLDVLNAVATENVCLRFKNSNSSVLITNDDDSKDKYVIMPIRL